MQYFRTRTKSHTRGTPHIHRLGAASKICQCWLRTSHVVLPCCRCGCVVLYCTCGCLNCCVAGHVPALNMHLWCCVVHVCGCISIMLALTSLTLASVHGDMVQAIEVGVDRHLCLAHPTLNRRIAGRAALNFQQHHAKRSNHRCCLSGVLRLATGRKHW